MEFTKGILMITQGQSAYTFQKEVYKVASLMGLTMMGEDIHTHKELLDKVISDPFYIYNMYVLKGVDPITPESSLEDVLKATEYMDKNYPELCRLFLLKQV